MTIMRGRAWVYGDNINTDVIFPGKYTYTLKEPAEIAAHALEDLDPRFAREVQRGDVIFAGRNFGCGSSREQAVTCLIYAGVGAVVVESAARIFFRNAINNGLPVIICPQAVKQAEPGKAVAIDLEKGTIRLEDFSFSFPAYPPFIQRLLNAGGLVPHVRATLKARRHLG